MSIFDEIRATLVSKGKTLTCDLFKDSVKIVHADGSVFLLENVIVGEARFGEMDVYLIWTEHCGYFYFFKDDLECFRQWRTNS